MKQERMSGGWKEDNMIDGIAYEALLIGEMDSLDRSEAVRRVDALLPNAEIRGG
jgi:hypothetical protein